MKATCMDGPLKDTIVDLSGYGPPSSVHGGRLISIPEPLKAENVTFISPDDLSEESLDLKFHTYMMRVEYSGYGVIRGVTLWAEK